MKVKGTVYNRTYTASQVTERSKVNSINTRMLANCVLD